MMKRAVILIKQITAWHCFGYGGQAYFLIVPLQATSNKAGEGMNAASKSLPEIIFQEKSFQEKVLTKVRRKRW